MWHPGPRRTLELGCWSDHPDPPLFPEYGITPISWRQGQDLTSSQKAAMSAGQNHAREDSGGAWRLPPGLEGGGLFPHVEKPGK